MSDTPEVQPGGNGGTSSTARAKAAKRTEIADRRRRVTAMARARMALREIQAALVEQTGIRVGLSTISRDLIKARAEWRDEARVSIAAAQEHDLANLANDEARLRGFLGKLAPDAWKARCAYQGRILEIMHQRAKLLGLDAPTKIDQTVHGATAITIEYVNDWRPGLVVQDTTVPAPVAQRLNGSSPP